MNAQWTTIEKARALVTELNSRGIGGGVLPEDASDDYKNDGSGIYREKWGGPFVEPGDGDYKPYLLRFANGGAGINTGLVIDRLRRYPMSPDYVYRELAKEVAAMALSNQEQS